MPAPPLDPGAAAQQPLVPSALAPGLMVDHRGDAAVVTLRGVLDADVGRSLVDCAASAAARLPRRLDIDVRALESFTREGAAALAACRRLGAGLAEGLHYRTGRGPGREALLAAYDGGV